MSTWKITLGAAALGLSMGLAVPQAFAQEPATAAPAKVDPARIAAAKDLLQAMAVATRPARRSDSSWKP